MYNFFSRDIEYLPLAAAASAACFSLNILMISEALLTLGVLGLFAFLVLAKGLCVEGSGADDCVGSLEGVTGVGVEAAGMEVGLSVAFSLSLPLAFAFSAPCSLASSAAIFSLCFLIISSVTLGLLFGFLLDDGAGLGATEEAAGEADTPPTPSFFFSFLFLGFLLFLPDSVMGWGVSLPAGEEEVEAFSPAETRGSSILPRGLGLAGLYRLMNAADPCNGRLNVNGRDGLAIAGADEFAGEGAGAGA